MPTLRLTMDDALYEAIEARALQHNRSLAQKTVAIIQERFNWPKLSPKEATEAFIALAGMWADDRPADEIVRDIKR